MNFTDILIVSGITTCIVAPISIFIALFICAIGVRNKEEEAYRLGFEDGKASKENV